MNERTADHRLSTLLERVEDQLRPGLLIRSVDPHDPVRVDRIPQPWRTLGCGNYAAVLVHPDHPEQVVKFYAPGRPGIEQEAEVYRRIGHHAAYSQCFHVGEGYLVLRRLQGITLYDCIRTGSPIPLQAMQDIDEAIAYAVSRGLHGHDVHGRNVMVHEGRGLIVDISDFLNPEPCRAWQDLRWAYHRLYRPLIAPLGLQAPGPVLDLVRRSYRLYRRLNSQGRSH
ncbi:serine/threonine protein kinase [Synechococcus sp. CBW1006]|uniref:serine/threonine protein kinase n=1 Tax=Synechococcus sp. CBW1006 TaxID=1353138 RepID=UPI0018CD2C79|nr:serine/threonine protein kinase [Synechococcus sp. CBW1006]QPN66530.1 serine/threonine protein kinase [Synechococcus sp. CBW1006]